MPNLRPETEAMLASLPPEVAAQVRATLLDRMAELENPEELRRAQEAVAPTVGAVDANADRIEALNVRDSFTAFVRMFWSVADPSTPFIENIASRAICAHLQAVGENKLRRLLINVGPGLAKSLLTAVLFPAWMWLRRPGWQVICGSYAMDLATRDAQRSRDVIRSAQYEKIKAALGQTWTIAKDQDLKAHFANTEKGFRLSVSIGSKATGFRADCVAGDTLVATEMGEIPIRDLVALESPPRVWSMNHDTGNVELASITASRVQFDRPVGTLRAGGKELICTHDHRIFAGGRGYVRASEFESEQAAEDGTVRLSGLQENAAHPLVRISKTPDAERGREVLLQQPLRVDIQPERHSAASLRGQELRQTAWPESGARRQEILFESLLARAENVVADPLQDMRDFFSDTEFPAAVLLGEVRGPGPFRADAREEQFSLQRRHELQQTVQADERASGRARRESVLGVRGCRAATPDARRSVPDQSGRAPHRRKPPKQSSTQSDYGLRFLPRHAPQIKSDPVPVVFRPRGDTVDVYDIAVAGNSNFFANGILVHNCLIFDDLLNAKEPEKITKESIAEARSWWKVTMSSRLNNLAQGVKIGIMQRVAEHDPCEDMIMSRKPDGSFEYDLLALPSLYDPDLYKALGRPDARTSIGWQDPRTKPGELLFPELFSAEVLAQAKSDMGSMAFAAQHGQRPAPSSGGFFQKTWWRFWVPEGVAMPKPVWVDTPKGIFECPQIYLPRVAKHTISCDFAFKATKTSDFVVMQVWAYGDTPGLKQARFLLDQTRGRLDFVATCDALENICARWPQATTKLIEDKANGPAVMAQLRDTISGVIAIEPLGGKEARAAAVSPLIESGCVYLPHPSVFPWVADLMAELNSFPAGSDDQVDSLTQFLSRRRITVV